MRSCVAAAVLLWSCVAVAQSESFDGGVPIASAPALMLSEEAAPAGELLTLKEALETALRQQPSLLQTQAALEVSRARVEQASAGLFPQLTANGAYQRSTANFAPRPGSVPSSVNVRGTPSFKSFDFFNFGLTANQLVYDFGQTIKGRDVAKVTVEARTMDQEASKIQVAQNVRVAFFNARAAKALIAVQRETLDNQQRHLEQTEGFVRVGTHAAIDLAQARVDRANAVVALLNADNAYASAKATLNQAMGSERSLDYDVADDEQPAIDGEEAPLGQLVLEALRRRPELDSIQRQARAQQLQLSAVQGGYGPSLSVATTASEAGRELGSLVWNWNAGATLTWPLFQGGLTRGKVDEARATFRGLQAQLQALAQQVRLQVTQAQLSVRSAKAVLVASEEVVTNARERLRLAEGRYAAGIGSGIELSDAQLQLSSALGQRVQAEYNLAAARAQLAYALGLPVS